MHPKVIQVSLWIAKRHCDMKRTGKGNESLWEVPVHPKSGTQEVKSRREGLHISPLQTLAVKVSQCRPKYRQPSSLKLLQVWMEPHYMHICKLYTDENSKLRPFASYLLILRCLVAIVEQLEVQVLVLLEEILKLILLCRRGRQKTAFRTQELTMIRPE